MDVKLIRAFIASPSGLDEERRAAHAVAQQVNDTVAREMGGRLELIGWEETLSGMGRPQAHINADMETCDLFIGAIWTKWGSKPALDGPYTSGFEEEFELSRARHERSGSPLMTVFFKEIDPLQLQDPGDELKKVLAFQDRLKVEKILLYETFATPDAFADKVRAFLTRHTIRLLQRPSPTLDEKAAEPQQLKSSLTYTNSKTVPGTVAETPESEFLTANARALREEDGPSPIVIARIRLIGATAGKAENDKILLGAHDANLLYQERRSYAFSYLERRGLLETGLAALDHENVPLWTWLADLTTTRRGFLIALTIMGEDDQRVGALAVMRLLAAPIELPDYFKLERVETYWLAEDVAARVRVAALRYLRDHGVTSHLAAIETEVARADNETLTAALEAALAIHLRDGVADAARYILSVSFETLDERLLELALNGFSELGNEVLERGLDHRSAAVRARTIERLSERSALTVDTVERAKDDDAPRVRLAALWAFERLGQTPMLDEARKIMVRPRTSGLLFLPLSRDTAGEAFFEAYLTERLRRMPLALVEALLSSTRDRHAAYLALAARRAGNFAEQLRGDLKDNFASYAERQWPDGIKAQYAPAVSLLSFGTADPLEVKRRDLVRQALDIVADQRDEKDLDLVRRVIDSKFLSPTLAAIRFIRALGDAEDVERMGRVSQYSGLWSVPESSLAFDEAARAILSLKSDVLCVLTELKMPDRMIAKVVNFASNAAFERLPDMSILKLLLTEKPLLRRAAAMKVPASLPRRRVRRLLEAYRADPEGRYYVVPHWLDLGLAYPRAIARRVVLSKG